MIEIGSPPVKDIIDTNIELDWTEFYPDAAENLPSKRPEPLGNLCTITTYVDADHARDQVTRRSVTGIGTTLLYLCFPNGKRRLNPPPMGQRWLPPELLLSRLFL